MADTSKQHALYFAAQQATMQPMSGSLPRVHRRCSASAHVRRVPCRPPHASEVQQQPETSDAPHQPPLLQDVRVVLVAPKTPANIGAVARCCGNFEVSQLWVVAPRCDPKDGEAYKVACRDHVINSLVVVDDLSQALADTAGSVGFTRRAGATRLTYASISHMLCQFPSAIPAMTLQPQQLQQHPSQPQQLQQPAAQSAAGPCPTPAQADGAAGNGTPAGTSQAPVTAIVFGREESGLTEAELRLCSHACSIPTGPVQGSMNLSHAVAVVLNELYQRRLAHNHFLALSVVQKAQALAGLLTEDDAESAPLLAALPLLLPPSRALPSSSESSGSLHSHGSPQDEGEGGHQLAASSLSTSKRDEALQPATVAEFESLMSRVSAIAQAVGLSGEESRGGGNKGNHGRRRLPVGHVRAVMSRAKPLQGEVRSLHGLASKVLARLLPSSGQGSQTEEQGKD